MCGSKQFKRHRRVKFRPKNHFSSSSIMIGTRISSLSGTFVVSWLRVRLACHSQTLQSIVKDGCIPYFILWKSWRVKASLIILTWFFPSLLLLFPSSFSFSFFPLQYEHVQSEFSRCRWIADESFNLCSQTDKRMNLSRCWHLWSLILDESSINVLHTLISLQTEWEKGSDWKDV